MNKFEAHAYAHSITKPAALCLPSQPLQGASLLPGPRRLVTPPMLGYLPSTCTPNLPLLPTVTPLLRAVHAPPARVGRAAGRGEWSVDGGQCASTCPNSPPLLPTSLLRAVHAPPARTPQYCRPARDDGGCGARREGVWWMRAVRALPASVALAPSCSDAHLRVLPVSVQAELQS